MDISGFVTRLTLEIKAFFAATEQRAYFLDRITLYFDAVAKKVNFPGPDHLVVPMIRASLLWVAGTIYDAIDGLDGESSSSAMAGLPAPPVIDEEADPCVD